MSNFESRIQRQQEAINQAREETKAKEDVSKREAEIESSQRLDRIESDERYHKLKQIAFSPELKQALEKYRNVFGGEYVSKSPINILFVYGDEPVGYFYIQIAFQERVYTEDGAAGMDSNAKVIITWREKETKRELVKEGRSGRMYSPAEYKGADAKEGLGIEFRHRDFLDSQPKSAAVFNELSAFLDHLANLVIKKMEDPKYKLIGNSSL